MKKGDFAWSTLAKLILALIILLFVLTLYYLLKGQFKDILDSIVSALRLR